jgi:hypothetical protein
MIHGYCGGINCPTYVVFKKDEPRLPENLKIHTPHGILEQVLVVFEQLLTTYIKLSCIRSGGYIRNAMSCYPP